MTALEQILKEEMESEDHVSIMIDNNDDIDTFISDLEKEELEKEICPICGKNLMDCECIDDDSEEYYYEEELPDELDDIDDSLYEFAEASSKKFNALNEVYFGKSKELIECESLLGAIRRKYVGSSYNIKLNTDPLLLEFNEKMANIFGLHCYELYIQPGHTYNAYTIPISWSIDYNPKKCLADKDGFKYNKAAKYSVMSVVYQGLMFSDKFTDQELMAIIIHEMGHNFSSVIDGNIRCINMVMMVYELLSDITNMLSKLKHLAPSLLPTAIQTTIRDIKIYVKKNITGVYYIEGLFESIQAIIIDVFRNVQGIIDCITYGKFNAIHSIVTALKKGIFNILIPLKYEDEKIADSFAAAYGYSQDLQSALYKMEKYEGGVVTKEFIKNISSQIPLFGAIDGILELPSYIIVHALDEHPMYIERSNSSIRLLEKELSKSNLDPKMRKVIENDLELLKKKQKEILDTTSNGIGDHMYIKKIYWSWLSGAFKGDLKHNLFDSKYIEKLDSEYNKAQQRNTEIDKVKLI